MNSLYSLTLIILMSFCFSIVAVEAIDDSGRLRFSMGKLHYIDGNIESSVRSYLEGIQDKLGHENVHRFPLDYYKDGINNTRHLSFQQTYKGIPVFGRYVLVHIHGEVITSLSCNIESFDLSTIPIITASGAMTIISPGYIYTSTYLKYQKLQIYIHNNNPYLAHTIDVVNIDNAWRHMVDALTGQIIDSFPLIYEDGPVIGSGINLLNESVDTIHIYEGNSFTPIGHDLVTPFLLCEEYCFDYGDCGGDNYADCVVSPQQGSCEDGYILFG